MATREAQLRDALGLDSDASGDTDRAADGPADGPAGGREPLSPLKARALLDDLSLIHISEPTRPY